jgi:hypothetical protein
LVVEVDDAASCVTYCAHPEERLIDGVQEHAELFPVIGDLRLRHEVLR